MTVDPTTDRRWKFQFLSSRCEYVIVMFLLALLLRLACFTGLVASDDLGYSCFAQLISTGVYPAEHHAYAVRYGLLVPLGLVYRFVGVSEWSTVALPLLASTVSSALLAVIGRRLIGPTAGVIAGLLYATFPLELHYATILVPETLAACYLLAGVLVYVSTEERYQGTLGWLTGLLVGLAYLTKEPALFVAPALLIDVMRRRRWRHGLGILVGVAAVVVVEHVYYVAATGDIFFRLHATVSNNQYVREVLSQESRDLAERLFKAYPRMMLFPNTAFGIHSLVALAGAAIALLQYRTDRRSHFLFVWSALPWLYLNFGTSDLNSYLLLPVAPRYIDFAYPPLFLLTAWLLATWWKSVSLRPVAVTALALASVVGVGCGLSTRGQGYLADHVAIIRPVVSHALEQGHHCIGFDAPRWLLERWQAVVSILSHGRMTACTLEGTPITLIQNGLGLPSVIESRFSRPEVRGHDQMCTLLYLRRH